MSRRRETFITVKRPIAFNRGRRSRRGWTLVEVVLATSLGTIVVGVAVEMLGLAMQADSVGRDRLAAAAALDRAAEQFRSDAHLADAVTAPAAKQGTAQCTLQLPDGARVEYAYTPADHTLRRTEYRAAAAMHSRDAFMLADGAAVHWETRAAEGSTIVSLIVDCPADAMTEDSPPAAQSNSNARITARIDARVGSDRRLAEAAKKAEAK